MEAVDEETMVLVFGDHGMTSTGDHGGETELETHAALLVYSKQPLFHHQQVTTSRNPFVKINALSYYLKVTYFHR